MICCRNIHFRPEWLDSSVALVMDQLFRHFCGGLIRGVVGLEWFVLGDWKLCIWLCVWMSRRGRLEFSSLNYLVSKLVWRRYCLENNRKMTNYFNIISLTVSTIVFTFVSLSGILSHICLLALTDPSTDLAEQPGEKQK